MANLGRSVFVVQALLLTACASSDPKDGHLDNEKSVPLAAQTTTGQCSDVEGTYADEGVALRSQIVKQPRLGHSLFRLALLGSNGKPMPPEVVTLSLDQAKKIMSVKLANKLATRDWSAPYECINGWVYVVDEMGEQYLGDGVTLLKYTYTIMLAADPHGSLVANTRGAAEYSTYSVQSQSQGNEWYLFHASVGK